MAYRTPAETTPEVLALCREVNPDAQPIYMRIDAQPDCEPNDCFMCIRRKVEAEGGRMQTGWSIWEWPGAFLRAEHHAVYEPESGPPWADITPVEVSEITRRLFLPDSSAIYDFENEGFRRNDRFKGLVADPLVYEYFQLATERNDILNSVPGVGAVSLPPHLVKPFTQNQQRILEAEMQLVMKYTPKNSRCPCGSGAKFKHCHGKA